MLLELTPASCAAADIVANSFMMLPLSSICRTALLRGCFGVDKTASFCAIFSGQFFLDEPESKFHQVLRNSLSFFQARCATIGPANRKGGAARLEQATGPSASGRRPAVRGGRPVFISHRFF